MSRQAVPAMAARRAPAIRLPVTVAAPAPSATLTAIPIPAPGPGFLVIGPRGS